MADGDCSCGTAEPLPFDGVIPGAMDSGVSCSWARGEKPSYLRLSRFNVMARAISLITPVGLATPAKERSHYQVYPEPSVGINKDAQDYAITNINAQELGIWKRIAIA